MLGGSVTSWGSTTRLILSFDGPQPAVTPGQSAVLYDGDTVLGGGVIHGVGDIAGC